MPPLAKGFAATIVLVTLGLGLGHPLVQPRLVRNAFGGGITNNTGTVSTSTSSETQTATETVRVDAFATRLVTTDPVGGLVSDHTLPLPFRDRGALPATAILP